MKTANRIATLIQAIENCRLHDNRVWLEKHQEALYLLLNRAPSGSGFDSGTKLDDSSKPERLVFSTAFHHMSGHGYYIGWSHHKVIVTASLLSGFDIRITGRDRRDIKSYIADTFAYWLGEETTI